MTRSIGKRIRALRERYMLTQEEMAKRILVSRNLLSELENGRRMPSGPLLVALEALFMANKDWILTGEGSMMLHQGLDGGSGGGPEESDEDVVSLLKGFRALSVDGRKKLMNILRVFVVVEKEEIRACP